HRVVEVQAAQEDVTPGGLHLEDPVADLDDAHVEGAAAEVVDQRRLVQLLADAVGQGGGGGLVDDPHHLDAHQLAGVLHRLALPVVEVGGHGDHRAGDGHPEVVGGDVADLVQDASGDFLEVELAAGGGGDPGVPVARAPPGSPRT